MSRPKLLDLYCCQGGASAGYVAAGFEVVGVDLNPQPNYPFEFYQLDLVDPDTLDNPDGPELKLPEFLLRMAFAVGAGSPPCQRYSKAQRIQGREHPDLIGPTRRVFQRMNIPYVIENVEDARDELIDPVTLCGASFGLHTYRHRLFESNLTLEVPEHAEHVKTTVKMGRALKPGDFYHAVGNFSNVDYVREDMGVPWMNRDGIRECIPPAYTEFIGAQLLNHLQGRGEIAA